MEQTDKGAPAPEIQRQEKVIKPLDFRVTALRFLNEPHVISIYLQFLGSLLYIKVFELQAA